MPRCGNHVSLTIHATVADVRACYQGPEHDDGATQAERAYERHLEDRGYEDARAQDAYEQAHGVVGFIDAWHAASPETCPCDRHYQPPDL